MKTSVWKHLILPFAIIASLAGLAVGNEYYTHGGYPATGSVASSSGLRAELDSITTGFNLLPTLAGNANKAVVINSGATGLTTTAGTLGLAGNLSTTGAFNTTLAQGATTTLTLPLVNGTLATLAGTETFTNHTYTNAIFAGASTGTYTLGGTLTITAPIFSGTSTGTYTLGGTPTYGSGTLTGGFAGDFTLSSSHACNTGYTRTHPNFCKATLPIVAAYTGPAVSCTGHTLDTNLPSNKIAIVKVNWRTKANNATGARLGATTFYGASNICAVQTGSSTYSTREQAATAAATILAEGNDWLMMTTNSGVFYSIDLNTGGNGTSEIVSTESWGYYD